MPHVLWAEQDDRIISKAVVEEYKKFSERMTILNSEELNYLQIRHIIGQCHIFIGGRTHAVISAYSLCVPSIALGYSIKSRGIAHDLELPEYMVVDSKIINNNNELLSSFQYLEKQYDDIKRHLNEKIPPYRNRLDGMIKKLEL